MRRIPGSPLSAIFFIISIELSRAREHVVGDSIWSIPPSNSFYINWSNNRTFVVGDTLVLRFEMGFYDVVQVSRREFEDCSAENAFQTVLVGPAMVSLDKEGMHYFICSFGNYCLLGQKIAVAVQRRPPPATPSPATPPAAPPLAIPSSSSAMPPAASPL